MASRIGLGFRSVALGLGLGLLASACGGGGSSNSPTSPSATTSGLWTGTLTRPSGLGTLALSWQASKTDEGLSGPLTLTNGNVSMTVQAKGNTAGNDSNGYTLHMQFNSNAGDSPSIPTCSVRGNSQGTADSFSSPYSRITVASFSVQYNACPGLIVPTQPFVQEVVQLSLSK